MHNFSNEYKRLNNEQRNAVDAIDGPLLVLAGPGTGKTQLLGLRVANILLKTDTPPENVLCLTFTENGARNMRERLVDFIGQAAYDVNIGTYHAFGGELIKRFPEYFGQIRLQSPVDDLGRHEILASIVDKLSYLDPLKQTRHHLGDLMATISEVKRALLTPEQLQLIAKENLHAINLISLEVGEMMSDFKTMPRKLDAALEIFEQINDILIRHDSSKTSSVRFGSLQSIAHDELKQAINESGRLNKTTPLTKWKNRWLAKDASNKFILVGELHNKRLNSLADVLLSYQNALEQNGLYDFDDMILRAIDALENNSQLKFTLHEQYLYLLLDEFQDTNAAQLRLVELLSDNPVNEGRPNVMAVGDDDQAIYAFQGATYSNMLDFYNMFTDTSVINLVNNYRSSPPILELASGIASQIDERIHHNFKNINKSLISFAKYKELPLERHEFTSDVDQYAWIAKDITRLIKQGTSASQIAVLSPKHRYLEPLVPYLNELKVPVRYEKRENILESKVVNQLLTMSRLALALHSRNEQLADSLWPEVLSYDFWEIPTELIWEISWNASGNETNSSWAALMLKNKKLRPYVSFFLEVAGRVNTETLETMLDYLTGNITLKGCMTSPLKSYFSNQHARASQPDIFYETLSHLTVIRTRLRDHQAGSEKVLLLPDFIDFVEQFIAADQRMINTSPYNQANEAVQLMTVFKSKGLEFEHVYLTNCDDQTWGDKSRTNSNTLTLPANLNPIRHAGATRDERLRILFVAATRAKQRLVLSSFAQNYAGRATTNLSYLTDLGTTNGKSGKVLPEKTIYKNHNQAVLPTVQNLENNWYSRHLASIAKTQLKSLLQDRLDSYQLSPTHLNSFTDMIFGGPEQFFFNTILRFPSAPSSAGQFGNAIHESLEWMQSQITIKNTKVSETAVCNYFDMALTKKKLPKNEHNLMLERGHHALKAFLKQRGKIFKPTDKAEHNFRNEGVFINDAHLSGKVDRMEIDKAKKEITVVDYKTGKSFQKWESNLSLHKYRQQLYCYKLLIENSHSFKGYRVTSGRLEFIEPDSRGNVHHLELKFENTELERIKKLVSKIWRLVKELNLPDTSTYKASLSGTKAFENDLLK